jgi:hypothetical protein
MNEIPMIKLKSIYSEISEFLVKNVMQANEEFYSV